jgi:Antibiotic biosynthesis monooxygenase
LRATLTVRNGNFATGIMETRRIVAELEVYALILEAAPLQVRAGMTEAFESAFREAQAIISSMPGYRSHELQRCIEREGHYLAARSAYLRSVCSANSTVAPNW